MVYYAWYSATCQVRGILQPTPELHIGKTQGEAYAEF